MDRSQLIDFIHKQKSFLCIGLDSDYEKIPPHIKLSTQSILDFNKKIIEATHEFCVAFKINTAFYESLGEKGWEIMRQTVEIIPKTHLTIADAKRGDIGNTSSQYAKAFFDELNFDAVTVSPYMGEDSIRPFLDYKDKWTIVLALTSNAGASDFELAQTPEGYLFERVLKRASSWGSTENLMFVVGATKTEYLKAIRQIVPDHFLLIPGVGTQGGDLATIAQVGLNRDIGLLVNVSREIIFASQGADFAVVASERAKGYQIQMAQVFK